MNGRGRLLVNMVKNINDDDPTEDLGEEHFQRMCNLNRNPDPTFLSQDSIPDENMLNEYIYCNNMDLLRDHASSSLVQIHTEKSEDSADTRAYEDSKTSSSTNQELQIITETSARNDCSGLKMIQNCYGTYSDSTRSSSCDSDHNLITPDDLDIAPREPSRTAEDFMLPSEINSDSENMAIPGILEQPYREENITLELNQSALDYNSDDSSVATNLFEDYSATDGSDYVPSSKGSDTTNFGEDEMDLVSTVFEECHRVQQELKDSTTAVEREGHESPSILVEQVNEPLVEPVNEPDELMEDQEQPSNSGRPLRGRKRKCPQSRSERKQARNSNKEYYDHKLRYKPPRDFIDYTCKCKNKCQVTVPLQTRISFHKKFWTLGSYNSQTNFLGVFVKEVRSEKPTKRKQFLRKYKIETYTVCRDMFCKTLNICSTRISTAMDKIHARKPLLDQRGSTKGGENRVPDVRKQEIKEFINSLPLYTSHYSRSKTSAKFFKPGVTLSAVYEEYKAKLGLNSVSYSFFKKFFYSNFNIKVKILSKDTCNLCDKFRIELLNAEKKGEDVNFIKETHKTHLQQADRARSQLKIDMNLAKNEDNIECLTFDMQKTLPLPRIQTNIIFYKRQIWLYNLGIHSAKNNQSYCYTWIEGQAGRGAQEVGSSLLKHIDRNVSDTIKHLILWSDSCGGQNRNIKITLMMKVVLEMKPNLQSITFKYLMPGHSYLPNDKDFGDIERALKYNQRIYTPDDYIQIMAVCKKKNPLIICQMQSDDFYSIDSVEKLIINRKKTTSNNKVNWMKTRELKVTKTEQYHIYMKSDFDQADYDCLDITRKTSKRRQDYNNPQDGDFKSKLSKLWPSGKPIAEPKLRDIISIKHLIPEDARHFYDSLTSRDENIIDDDVDGLNAELDFDLEEEQ